MWIRIGLICINRRCAAFTRMICFSSVTPDVVNETPRYTDDSTFRNGFPDRKNVEFWWPRGGRSTSDFPEGVFQTIWYSALHSVLLSRSNWRPSAVLLIRMTSSASADAPLSLIWWGTLLNFSSSVPYKMFKSVQLKASPCGTPIVIVAQVLVMSLLVLTDRGCKRRAVMCRCSVFNRSWQTVDSTDLETRSYALIRSKTAMNLWLFKMVFPTSKIACSVPLYFVKPCWYLWNTTYLSTSRLMVADIVFLAWESMVRPR